MLPPAGGKFFTPNGGTFETTAIVLHGALTCDNFRFVRSLPPPPPPPRPVPLARIAAPSPGLVVAESPPQCWLSWCFFRS